MVLFIWRTSNPHVAVIGRINGTETYRNVLRHPVQTWPHVALVRIDAVAICATVCSESVSITASIGIAEVRPKPDDKDLKTLGASLIARADVALDALDVPRAMLPEVRDALRNHIAALC